jgi:hypothetical protein
MVHSTVKIVKVTDDVEKTLVTEVIKDFKNLARHRVISPDVMLDGFRFIRLLSIVTASRRPDFSADDDEMEIDGEDEDDEDEDNFDDETQTPEELQKFSNIVDNIFLKFVSTHGNVRYTYQTKYVDNWRPANFYYYPPTLFSVALTYFWFLPRTVQFILNHIDQLSDIDEIGPIRDVPQVNGFRSNAVNIIHDFNVRGLHSIADGLAGKIGNNPNILIPSEEDRRKVAAAVYAMGNTPLASNVMFNSLYALMRINPTEAGTRQANYENPTPIKYKDYFSK